MNTTEVLKQIVSELDFTTLPLHYITAISVIDEHGFEELYTGDDIEKVMKAEIKVRESGEPMFLIDTRAIYNTVQIEYFYVFEQVFKLIKQYEAEKDIDQE
jgi:hypothetical protein